MQFTINYMSPWLTREENINRQSRDFIDSLKPFFFTKGETEIIYKAIIAMNDKPIIMDTANNRANDKKVLFYLDVK